jgi:hypothetical protein
VSDPVALKAVRVGEPFELPDGSLVRVESVISGDRPYYLGYADHGVEVDADWLAARGFRVVEQVGGGQGESR